MGDVIDDDLDRYYNPSSQFSDPFTAEKDPILFQVDQKGTEDAPLWGIKEAEQFSVMHSQQDAMGKLIKNTVYNDLQMTSASNFTEYFKGKLIYDGKPVPEWKLRRNPIFYMENATIDSKTNPTAYLQAKTLKTQTKALLGEPTKTAEQLDLFKQKLFDFTYSVGGQKASERIPEMLIPMINDPWQYARAVAFHTKLGMFSPTQFLVQASGAFNTMVLAPRYVYDAFTGGTLMSQLGLTESRQILEHFGDLAEKMPGKWTKAKFIEAKEAMDSIGWDQIGGETSFRSSSTDPTLHRSTLGKVALDWGPFFFNQGERIVRVNAWNSAYLEFADKFPAKVGKMSRVDIQKIQERAKIFSGNMTRDSNAFWQHGAAGNFTQFWSYNIRMLELMVGKQLSRGERIRLAMGHAIMWGLPVGAGAYMAMDTGDPNDFLETIKPGAASLRIHAKKKGYDMDSSIAGALHDGLMSVLIQEMTGHHMGVGQRYGINNLQMLENIKDNYAEYNPIWASIITAMGPSGNIMADIVGSTIPTAKHLASFVNGDPPPASVMTADVMNAFREISGINTAQKIYFIMMAENWRSQKGNLSIEAADGNTLKEIVKAITGVDDMSNIDAFEALKDSKNMDAARNTVAQDAKRYIALSNDAAMRGDTEAAEEYLNHARILVNGVQLSTKRRMEILFPSDASQTRTSERLWNDWLGKLSPEQRMNVENLEREQ
jgi:hypothetical protein